MNIIKNIPAAWRVLIGKSNESRKWDRVFDMTEAEFHRAFSRPIQTVVRLDGRTVGKVVRRGNVKR